MVIGTLPAARAIGEVAAGAATAIPAGAADRTAAQASEPATLRRRARLERRPKCEEIEYKIASLNGRKSRKRTLKCSQDAISVHGQVARRPYWQT